MNEREKVELPILPFVAKINDDAIEDEDALAYAKEREVQRAESRNAPSDGFDSH